MSEKSRFDFASIDGHLEAQESGAEVSIVLPGSGRETGLKITVSGPDSERVKRAVRWGRDKRTAASSISDEADEAITRETVARCCSGWTGANYNGQAVDFSVEEAVKWFEKWPFVQRQASNATGDLGRFMKA